MSKAFNTRIIFYLFSESGSISADIANIYNNDAKYLIKYFLVKIVFFLSQISFRTFKGDRSIFLNTI